MLQQLPGKSDDWYTPPEIFSALGLTFDLDPCSPGPSHWVPAQFVCTREQDGLRTPWPADYLVFMNPPFGGRNEHVPWLKKFLTHGNGVAVVMAYTSASWWHDHIPRAQMLLFPRGKTQFVPSEATRAAIEARTGEPFRSRPGMGIALVGMGTVACEALAKSGLGMVWDRRNLVASTGVAR